MTNDTEVIAGESIVAECRRDGYVDIRESRANASLISAAPELLEVAETWLKYAESNGWTDADHHDADGTGWISAARAAIAKAKGGRG